MVGSAIQKLKYKDICTYICKIDAIIYKIASIIHGYMYAVICISMYVCMYICNQIYVIYHLINTWICDALVRIQIQIILTARPMYLLFECIKQHFLFVQSLFNIGKVGANTKNTIATTQLWKSIFIVLKFTKVHAYIHMYT